MSTRPSDSARVSDGIRSDRKPHSSTSARLAVGGRVRAVPRNADSRRRRAPSRSRHRRPQRGEGGRRFVLGRGRHGRRRGNAVARRRSARRRRVGQNNEMTGLIGQRSASCRPDDDPVRGVPRSRSRRDHAVLPDDGALDVDPVRDVGGRLGVAGRARVRVDILLTEQLVDRIQFIGVLDDRHPPTGDQHVRRHRRGGRSPTVDGAGCCTSPCSDRCRSRSSGHPRRTTPVRHAACRRRLPRRARSNVARNRASALRNGMCPAIASSSRCQILGVHGASGSLSPPKSPHRIEVQA